MASINQFKRYLWLVDVIYSAGEITRDEINRRWVNSVCNESKESVYPERTFHRHREDIAQLFGIEIECSKSAGNIYRIANKEQMKERRSWVIDNFAINNLVNFDPSVGARIIFEDIPEGNRYLGTIATAMQEGKMLWMSYQGFNRTEAHAFLLAPYCLKVFHQRWYMVGKPEDHPEETEPRVYALDRVKDITITDNKFKIPHDFKPSKFFEAQFGVDRRLPEAERIRVKVSAATANYIRTLPIHGSQFELERNDTYSIFGFYVAPTYDLVQEFRKHGSNLEVLDPAHLREDFKQESAYLGRMYWD